LVSFLLHDFKVNGVLNNYNFMSFIIIC